MNRIVLGVDREKHYEAALSLLTRLRPNGAAIDLFHVAEIPVLYSDMTVPSTMELMAEVMEEEKATGSQLCKEVAKRLDAAGLFARVVPPVGGYPAAELMHYADRIGARMLAVGSGNKGAVRSFFTGSVGRALVVGAHRSVLVAKGEPASTGPLRAVFATDHSPYADRCLTELLALNPRGISHLTVVTCYPKEFARSIRPFLPEFVLDPTEWIETSLQERNAKAVTALAPLGGEIDSRIVDETATTGIPRVMAETKADLLILGAQGHGFIERLTLGSTSFHQVMAEPYPVLVLRVPEAAAVD